MTVPLHPASEPAPARRPHLFDEWEIRFAAGISCQVVATFVVCVAGVPYHDSFAVVLVVSALASLTLGPVAGATLGLIGWALFTGFVTNSLAQLTFRSQDLRFLGVLVGSCLALAYGSGRVGERAVDRRPRPRRAEHGR